MQQLILGWLVLGGIVVAALFATKTGEEFSRVWVGVWLAGGFTVTLLLRTSVRLLLRVLRRHGHNRRHIAIVGAGALVRTIAERLAAAPWAG